MATRAELVKRKTVPPWRDFNRLSANAIVKRLREQVDAVDDAEPARAAARGLVVAVGNYEALGKQRKVVLTAATELMQMIDRSKSRYWG